MTCRREAAGAQGAEQGTDWAPITAQPQRRMRGPALSACRCPGRGTVPWPLSLGRADPEEPHAGQTSTGPSLRPSRGTWGRLRVPARRGFSRRDGRAESLAVMRTGRQTSVTLQHKHAVSTHPQAMGCTGQGQRPARSEWPVSVCARAGPPDPAPVPFLVMEELPRTAVGGAGARDAGGNVMVPKKDYLYACTRSRQGDHGRAEARSSV